MWRRSFVKALSEPFWGRREIPTPAHRPMMVASAAVARIATKNDVLTSLSGTCSASPNSRNALSIVDLTKEGVDRQRTENLRRQAAGNNALVSASHILTAQVPKRGVDGVGRRWSCDASLTSGEWNFAGRYGHPTKAMRLEIAV